MLSICGRGTAYKLRMPCESVVAESEILETTARTKEAESLEKEVEVAMTEVEGVDVKISYVCDPCPELEKSANNESCVVVLAAVHIQGMNAIPKRRRTRKRLYDRVETTFG